MTDESNTARKKGTTDSQQADPQNPPLHAHEMLAQEFEAIHCVPPPRYEKSGRLLKGPLQKLKQLIKKVDECDPGKSLLGEADEAKRLLKQVIEIAPESQKLVSEIQAVISRLEKRIATEQALTTDPTAAPSEGAADPADFSKDISTRLCEARERLDSALMREIIEDLHGARQAALCISGGGIRSATFALGVLQALASREWLGKFHYLSTVSGGGYIGSWLTAWIHHETNPAGKTKDAAETSEGVRREWGAMRKNALACVQRQLVSEQEPRATSASWHEELCIADPISPLHPEPRPLEHLRAYSNYLSPRLGLLSGDSWTLVAIYLRNLLLNWLVIVPWLFLALLAPRIAVQILRWTPVAWANFFSEKLPAWAWNWIYYGLYAVGTSLAAGGLIYAIGYMGSHLPRSRKHDRRSEKDAQTDFIIHCLVPLLIAGGALTTMGYWHMSLLHEKPATVYAWMAFFSVGAHLAPSLCIRRKSLRLIDWLAVMVSGALGGAVWTWAFNEFINSEDAGPERFVCFGVGLFFTAFLLGMTIFIGVTSYASRSPESQRKAASDADREWWARAGGWVLLAGLGWMALSAISLYGPRFLALGVKQIAAVGGISGLVTVLLGFSSKSGGKEQASTEKPGPMAALAAKAPEFAAPVFLIFLLIIISLLTTLLVYHFDDFGPAPDQKTAAGPGNGQAKARNTAAVNSKIAWRVQIAEDKERKKRVEKTEQELQRQASDDATAVTFKHEVVKRNQPSGCDPAASAAPHPESASDMWKEVQSSKASVPWLPPGYAHHEYVVKIETWSILGVLSAGFLILGWCASHLVNVNIFSLHGMYRDRLIRAYLAASRPDHQRKPNPFTGFDPDDNIPMFALWPTLERPTLEAPGGKAGQKDVPERRLFHVINTTLNLVSGQNLAWQERMASSFVMTPLHCGSADLDNGYGYRRTRPNSTDAPTRTANEENIAKSSKPEKAPATTGQGNNAPETSPGRYGGDKGITLGTAMTISGAAVNSNWGYHSSPVVTFLLALFNARLGWWLGNPSQAGDATYERWYPRSGIDTMFHEAFGLTDEDYPYVDLSDGGHFDNMGLYEMVRRRCGFIVLIDGEADGEYSYEGLGAAIRKIRIDFGISITFDEDEPLFVPKDPDKRGFSPRDEQEQPRYAVGEIHYSEMDGAGAENGILLYIKPVCYGTSGSEPRDVVQYKRSNPAFPHESTVDQFFSESQFESYRALGRFTGEEVMKGVEATAALEKLKTFLKPT